MRDPSLPRVEKQTTLCDLERALMKATPPSTSQKKSRSPPLAASEI
jgi:hypothetical protein